MSNEDIEFVDCRIAVGIDSLDDKVSWVASLKDTDPYELLSMEGLLDGMTGPIAACFVEVRVPRYRMPVIKADPADSRPLLDILMSAVSHLEAEGWDDDASTVNILVRKLKEKTDG
jgi:hypothetical protein